MAAIKIILRIAANLTFKAKRCMKLLRIHYTKSSKFKKHWIQRGDENGRL